MSDHDDELFDRLHGEMVDHALSQVEPTPIGVPIVPAGWGTLAQALGIFDGTDDWMEEATDTNGAVRHFGVFTGDIRNDPRWPDYVRWVNERYGTNIPVPEPAPVEPLPPAGWVHTVKAIEAGWIEAFWGDNEESTDE